MPHLIIEYAHDMDVEDKIPAMLDAVHQAAVSTGLFVDSHVKVRAVPVMHYRIGTGHDPFIHAQLRIQMGRDQVKKRNLSETVLQAIRNQCWPAKIMTVEVIEMDTPSYAKYPV